MRGAKSEAPPEPADGTRSATRAAEPVVRCRVCLADAAEPSLSVQGRSYFRCRACLAIFLDAAQLPGPEEERARYALHDNEPNDEGYRRFLGRVAAPLLARLPPGSEGLDYGSGPGPVLAGMLAGAGHTVRLYDPFFHPDSRALERTYDFITCTETAEHFHRPARDFARLNRLLRPGGRLAVMTCFHREDVSFADWHYRRDPTHVVFYREETFRKLAARFDWRCEIPVANVVLMEKRNPAETPDDGRPARRSNALRV